MAEPVGIGGCFGWLHTPPGRRSSNVAVLLCPGLREDGLNGHAPFRRLAEAVAQAGYPCLRFDYPGTADSADPDPALPLWDVWRDSVNEAADWLRDVTGATELVLCGLRLGATLAAAAASGRTDVTGLVLLAPVPRGRSVVRQLSVQTAAAGKHAGRPMLNGVALSTASEQSIAAADLAAFVPPANCVVTMLNPQPTPVLLACAAAWSARGVVVQRGDFTGLEPLLRNRIMSHEPLADVSRVLAALPPCTVHGLVQAVPKPVFAYAGCQETPVRFGPHEGLFGILCQPGRGATDTAVLMLNTAGDPHYGADRGSADLARRFATGGYTSLRMDFSGLGDSVAPDDPAAHVFATDRRAEVSAGLDALMARGYQRLAVFGLCSGAFHAFRAVAADARVEYLVLVNLPVFEWRAGTGIERFNVTRLSRRPKALLRSALQREGWTQLLRGETDIRNRIIALQLWPVERTAQLWAAARRRLGVPARASFAQSAAAKMAGRTRSLILMSPQEAGLPVLGIEFGRSRTPPGAELHVMPEIDHSLTEPGMRARVAEMALAFLDRAPMAAAMPAAAE